MTTQEPVSQQAMRRSARRWAARLCAADVRYDEHADILYTAAEFAAVMEQRRFLQQFFVRPAEESMVERRLPPGCIMSRKAAATIRNQAAKSKRATREKRRLLWRSTAL